MQKNEKIKNFLIDSIFPIWFWGIIYGIITQITHIWTLEMLIQWFIMLVLLSPLSGFAGRILNIYRKKLKYQYEGYD